MRGRTTLAVKLRATTVAAALLLTLPQAFGCAPGPEYERYNEITYLRMEYPSKADFLSLLDRKLPPAPKRDYYGARYLDSWSQLLSYLNTHLGNVPIAAGDDMATPFGMPYQTFKQNFDFWGEPDWQQLDDFTAQAERVLPDPADRAIVQKLWASRLLIDLYGRCNHGDAITANLRSVTSPAAAVPLRDYLLAALAFDCRAKTPPKPDFADLAHSGNAWVAETAAYMLGRQALVGAQRRWPWFKPPTAANGVDMALLDTADAAFAAYRKRYPHGRYVASSIGLERRILRLKGDQAGLNRALLRMLAAVEADVKAGKLSYDQAHNRLREFARYFDGPIDANTASAFALAFLVVTGKPGDLKGVTPAVLAGNPDLAGFDDLRRLLIATLQYKTGDYAALAKTNVQGLDPAKPDPFDTLRLIAFARILSGDVAGAQDLLKALLRKNGKDYGLRMALAKSYEAAGNLLDAFADPLVAVADTSNNYVHFDDVVRDLVSLLSDDELLQLARRLQLRQTPSGAKSAQTSLFDFVKLVLYRRYITTKRYRAFDAAYAALGDAGSMAQFDAHVAAIRALAKNPHDPDSALEVGEFLQELNANRGEFETDPDPSEAMGAWFSARMDAARKAQEHSSPMNPYQYYLITMNAYHRTGRRGDAEADALHDLILCLKPHLFDRGCLWGGDVPRGNSALWFKRLHIKYKHSSQAAATPYYY